MGSIEWDGFVLGDGTTAANYVTAWSPASSTFVDAFRSPSQPSAGILSAIGAMALFAGKVYVGGDFIFTGDGTVSAKRIAAWDGSAWSVPTGGGIYGLGGTVLALAVFNSKLYVGGNFPTLGNGSSAKYIAAWDESAWSTLPVGGNNNGVGAQVSALAVFRSKLYIGGGFTALGDSSSAKYIVAWNGSTWSTISSGSSNGMSGDVYALAANGSSSLYMGGLFASLGNNIAPAGYFAAITI